MQIHGPDPGFVRPVELPPPALAVPTVQTAVAVTPTDETQASPNNVRFQDPNRDGRRSFYQEMGGKYIGFFRTKDLNLHRTINLELDFGPTATRQEYVIAMEAHLVTGIRGIQHGLGLTAALQADDLGRLVAVFPPLIKVLADPMAIEGFHVYAFPMTGPSRPVRPERGEATGGGQLNVRPKAGVGDRFDGSA